MSWKITAFAPRPVIEAALVAHEDALDWDPEIILSGSEVAEDRPDDWQLEAWLSHKPKAADKAALAALFAGDAPKFTIEKLPDTDWLVASQQDLQPIHAGRFHVHTPDHPARDEPGLFDFTIPASQAFGTGQHATTAGCLTMLTHMKAQGAVVRNCADIGTGTGLLAFAALALWPRALATASDIDAVCPDVVKANAQSNGVPMGPGAGQLVMTVADGMGHPLLAARGPYDLIMANILAGPLVSLAPDFGAALVPGGHLLLAGLLETQEAAVRAACRKAGLRLAARLVNGDWSILWLRKRGR
ncbi:50S ribosomal protein L11 methyltransferase [Novosphingobium beihaiensis]|uniref:Ribosomal protein L11 methyltransferase n=1 Tax=Novosphingobium beihaiensis TaxID=2930389 RepID=A0ABT0BJW2_9SPHN|nr:50S ribosomal protein L11 methyltransferase [Novosphingobium beihaiensis]MCJ2185337.1 50S ribosomal protein L11 methyltransferase [Novosphingobium beihaiensis]